MKKSTSPWTLVEAGQTVAAAREVAGERTRSWDKAFNQKDGMATEKDTLKPLLMDDEEQLTDIPAESLESRGSPCVSPQAGANASPPGKGLPNVDVRDLPMPGISGIKPAPSQCRPSLDRGRHAQGP